MALTSSSTRADAVAQANDNLTYWTSKTKAGNLLEALLWLKANRPKSAAGHGQASLAFEPTDELIEEVRASFYAQGGGNRVRFVRGRPL